MLWKAWSDPQHIAQWWGPNGFTTDIHIMDLKPGGQWNLTLHGPDGTNYPNKAIYKEVVPLKKIAFEHFHPDFISTIEFNPKATKPS